MRRYVFFFNDTATTEIYTLSLHDALPISSQGLYPDQSYGPTGLWPKSRVECADGLPRCLPIWLTGRCRSHRLPPDRKSTRLNSSHANISYAVFCLKKKKRYTVAFTPVSTS